MSQYNSKPAAQRCAEVVLSAKFWVFAEIQNVGLPVARPDAGILAAATLDTWKEKTLDWQDGEQQTRMRVDAVVQARVASRHASDLPLDLHYWYWIRLRSAQGLTRQLMPYDYSRTIFGVPASVTKEEFLRWLLISWWSDGGVAEWTNKWLDISDEIAKNQN